MEANRKRRGFVKGKLMPFYNRSSKPSPTSNMYVTSKVNPSQTNYMVSNPPLAKQKLSYIAPSDVKTNNNIENDKFTSQFERMFGAVGDEHVDAKTASYIAAVQERFKLERVNSKHEKNNHILQATN